MIETMPADLLTPLAVYLKLAGPSETSFLFESVEGGESPARYSFIGTEPVFTATGNGELVEIDGGGCKRTVFQPLFDFVRDHFSRNVIAEHESLPGFSGGAIAIGITGNPGTIDPAHFENLPGVADAIRVTKPYKLVSRDLRPERSAVRIGNSIIGDGSLAMIAGPCAVENESQVFETAEAVAASGAKFFRGGAFKPRTSPYNFQGLGEEGLRILAAVRENFGLNIVTEALDERGLEMVAKYADCIQIGARNMQNFSLLKYAGQTE